MACNTSPRNSIYTISYDKKQDGKERKKIDIKQKLALAMLASADFLSFCMISIMAPFYPKEATEKGMSETISGFVFGFYGFMVFVSSPFVGKLIPKVGVKAVFITGIILSGVTNLLFGSATKTPQGWNQMFSNFSMYQLLNHYNICHVASLGDLNLKKKCKSATTDVTSLSKMVYLRAAFLNFLRFLIAFNEEYYGIESIFHPHLLAYVNDYTLFTVFSFLIRGAQGLGTSTYSTASFVLITKIFPDHGGLVRGILEVFVGLGLSAGPAIGGFLFAIGGFGLPFYAVGIIFLAIAPLNKWFIPAHAFEDEEQKSGSFRKMMKVPSILVTCLILVVITITWSSLNPTLEPYLRKYDLTVTEIGFVFLVLSAAYGIFSPISGYLSDKIKHYWLLIVTGAFFGGVSLLFLAISPILFPEGLIWWDVIWVFFLGVFVGVGLIPTYQSVLDGAIFLGGFEDNIATQGLVAGLWSAIYSVGEAIGPVCGGTMLNYFGFSAMLLIMATANILGAVVCFIYFYFYREAGGKKNYSSNILAAAEKNIGKLEGKISTQQEIVHSVSEVTKC